MRRLSLLLLLLLLGCSGGGSASGGKAAPPPGPAIDRKVELTVEIPQQRTNEPLASVDVEVVDAGSRDPGSLSGHVVVAAGTAPVTPGATTVRVLVRDIPPGTWDVYAFGRTAAPAIVARAGPEKLDISSLALTLHLQLVNDSDPTLSITPTNPSLVVGTTQPFTARDQNGLDLTSSVTWTSSDPAVAGIDAAGVATALAPGPTTITATLGTASASTTLTVTPATIVSLAVSTTTPTIPAGLTAQFSAIATLSDQTTQDVTDSVTWTAAPGTVATVNGSGLATGLAPGQATLTASLNNLTASATLDVTPALLTRIDITPTAALTLSTGVTRQFQAVGTFTDSSTLDITTQVTWGTSNPAAVGISNAAGTNGLATALDDGAADLSATLSGIASNQVAVTARGEIQLRGPRNTVANGTAQSVTRGDWNGDGRQDFAACSGTAFRFYLNTLNAQGETVFVDSGTQPLPFTARQIATGDLNGDGRLDVVACSDSTNVFAFCFGNGDGTFGVPFSQFTISGVPTRLVTGRFNADAFEDVALCIGTANNVEVFLSIATGPVGPPFATVPVGAQPTGIGAGLFNGDGILDLAVSCFGASTVQVLTGTGFGGFTAQAPSATLGANPSDLAVGDFNGDGNLDVVTADGPANLTYLPGDGAGQFLVGSLIPLTNAPSGVAAGDFTGDGELDLLAGTNADVLNLVAGNGDGTFQAAAIRPLGSISDTSVSANAAVADFDLSGTLDAIVPELNNYFSLILSTVGNVLGTQSRFLLGPVVANSQNDVALGDLNGDGFNDIVVTNQVDGNLSVLLGDGAGGFTAAPGSPFAAQPGGQALTLDLADFNGDGFLDAAVLEINGISIMLNNGAGALTLNSSQITGFFGGEVKAGDLNNDGRADVAFSNNPGGPGNDVFVMLGNGDGTLQPAVGFNTGSNSCSSVALGDVNRDGFLDIVAAQNNNNQFGVLLNDGTGTAFTVTNFAVPATPLQDICLGDFDADGNLDVGTVSLATLAGYIYYGSGNGTFPNTPSVTIANVSVTPYRISAVDMNTNGTSDLVFQDNPGFASGGGAHVILCTRARTVTDAGIFDADRLGMDIGRVDADIRPDIVTVGSQEARAVVNFQTIPFP